jgi:hypothetical protein
MFIRWTFGLACLTATLSRCSGLHDGATSSESHPGILRAQFTPDERKLVLRTTEGKVLSFDRISREFRVISNSVYGYDTWISPSGRFGIGEMQRVVRDFESGVDHPIEPEDVDVLGFTPNADDLLLFHRTGRRWVRRAAPSGVIRWELPDPDGPRQGARAIWSSSGTKALVEAAGWCKLLDVEQGAFVPLNPDFSCWGAMSVIFDDDDLGFALERRSPHEPVSPLYYDLRSQEVTELELVRLVSLSVKRDRLWGLSGLSFQERRISSRFEVVQEREMSCGMTLRPTGTDWFLWACDRKQLQVMHVANGFLRPIGMVFERFGHGVLISSRSGEWVAHSENGYLQILATKDLGGPAPNFIAVPLPDGL